MSEQPPENPYQPPQGNPYQPYGAPTAWTPDHPQATTVLILGILGIAVCQVVAPFAWVIGRRTRAEIDANPTAYGGRQQVQIGYVLGIVGSCILALYVVGALLYVVVVIGLIAAGA